MSTSSTRSFTEHLANWVAGIATATTLATLATVSSTNNQVARLEEQNKAIKEQLDKIDQSVSREFTTAQSLNKEVDRLEVRIEQLERTPVSRSYSQ